jgi:RNA polymerase sigma factor (TIGR02999 family)
VSDTEETPGVITRYLREWRGGDGQALERLTTEVYSELRRRAAFVMNKLPGNRTIQPTALVHELYFQLPGIQHIDWQCRAQFLSVAAKMMRNILVDHARKRHAKKRGGTASLLVVEPPVKDPALHVDVLLIHQVLERFTVQYPRQSDVVELRFFGGLTAEETSAVLTARGIDSSLRTVERDWKFAQAWLHNAIQSQ